MKKILKNTMEEITVQEVEKELQKIKNNKTSGPKTIQTSKFYFLTRQPLT